MDDNLHYEFKNPMWEWKSTTTWYFIDVPKDMSEQIKFFSPNMKRGFGSVRVEVTIGSTTWKTSIFPSNEKDRYILPIKAAIRKKEALKVDTDINVTLDVC